MVSYGSGQLGDVTITEDTELTSPILEYQNLTVEQGATLTIPSRSRLLVTDTLILDGNIELMPDIPGDGSGPGTGGNSGGNLQLIAKNIEGDGNIFADGTDGASVNGTGNSSAGGAGAAYGLPAADTNGVAGSDPEQGAGADYRPENGWNGNRNGSSGGSAGTSMYNDGTLKSYLEDYLISGAYITQSPIDTILPGSGSSGGGGGSASLSDPTTDSNYQETSADVGGGGGGAGGSIVAKGGVGGNGDQKQSSSNEYLHNDAGTGQNNSGANVRGGDAAGGGGSGGFVLLVCESMSENVTISATGGNGGDGYWGIVNGNNTESDGSEVNFNLETSDRGGGGGGGGAGGFVVGFVDKNPTVQLNGGDGGVDGGNRLSGTSHDANAGGDGENGLTFMYDIEEIL